MSNNRILIIPDLHFPYAHPDCLDFLLALKKKYKPTRIINLGDELDYHAYSMHKPNPDLWSPGHELDKAIGYIQTLHDMFPKMDLMESNHGSLPYRKALEHGTPARLLKTYPQILEVGPHWKWHRQLVLSIARNHDCLFSHGRGANILRMSQLAGMSTIQGHYHNSFEVLWWNNGFKNLFGMTSGCLIDNEAMAFKYNKIFPKSPVIGASLILNGEPCLERMKLDKRNRWTGEL